jgi:hypothetical protein
VSPPERKPLISKDSIVKDSGPPITLKQLFEIDWPNLPAFYHECVLNSQVFDSGSVKVAWRVNGDFVGRSKFLAILIDHTTKAGDAFKACEAIADQYGHFIDSPNSEVDIAGQAPDDTAPTHLKDMVFSKRIFVYYEDFSLAQKGMLETIYQSKELSVQFRDAAYAWAHRDDKPRETPLVPNTTILPDAKLHEGLQIKITKLSPGVGGVFTEQITANQSNLQADLDGATIGHIYLNKEGAWSASYSPEADTWTGMRMLASNPPLKNRQVGAAKDISVSVEFEHDSGLRSGAATPTAWLHEKRGYVELKVGETKEAIIAVKNTFGWYAVTNLRDQSGYPADKTAMHFQDAPFLSGKMRIRLLADGRAVVEKTYSWSVEVLPGPAGSAPKIGYPKLRLLS